jgi:hypothetical protein
VYPAAPRVRALHTEIRLLPGLMRFPLAGNRTFYVNPPGRAILHKSPIHAVSPMRRLVIEAYSDPPARARAVRRGSGPVPLLPAMMRPQDRLEPCGCGTVPGRAVLAKSPNHLARSASRLIIEATYPV